MPHKSKKKNKAHARNVKKRRKEAELRQLGRMVKDKGMEDMVRDRPVIPMTVEDNITPASSTETTKDTEDVPKKRGMRMKKVTT